MKKSKVIQLLSAFKKEEFTQLREFLVSPYFNKSKQIVKLFDVLIKFAPEYDEDKIAKEKIYRKVFGNSKFNVQLLRNLSSELYKLIAKFISLNHTEYNPLMANINLLGFCIERHVPNIFEIESKQLESKLSEQPDMEGLNLLIKYDLLLAKKNFHRTQNQLLQYSKIASKETIPLLLHFLNHMMITAYSLSVSNIVFNSEIEENPVLKLYNKLDSNGMLLDLVNELKEKNLDDSNTVELHYYLAKSYIDADVENLVKVQELIFKNIDKLNLSFKITITDALLNVCIRRTNLYDDIKDFQIGFDLIKYKLENGLMIDKVHKYIPVYKFRNIFFMVLKLKEFEWLENFVANYINKVAPDYRDSLYHNLMAFLKFYKKNYTEALDHLNKVTFNQFVLKMDVKNLMLFINHELENYEANLSLIASYRQFLKNNQYVPKTFSNYLTLVEVFEDLTFLFLEFDEFKLKKLQDKLSLHSRLPNYDWFHEKISYLEMKHLKRASS